MPPATLCPIGNGLLQIRHSGLEPKGRGVFFLAYDRMNGNPHNSEYYVFIVNAVVVVVRLVLPGTIFGGGDSKRKLEAALQSGLIYDKQ